MRLPPLVCLSPANMPQDSDRCLASPQPPRRMETGLQGRPFLLPGPRAKPAAGETVGNHPIHRPCDFSSCTLTFLCNNLTAEEAAVGLLKFQSLSVMSVSSRTFVNSQVHVPSAAPVPTHCNIPSQCFLQTSRWGTHKAADNFPGL